MAPTVLIVDDHPSFRASTRVLLEAEGRSNAAIAESMVVTERAVEKHVSSIYGKLGRSLRSH